MRIEPTNMTNMRPGGAPYFMYMNEQEHIQKVNGVVKELHEYFQAGGDPNDIFVEAMRHKGLTIDDLTAADREKMNTEVFKQ